VDKLLFDDLKNERLKPYPTQLVSVLETGDPLELFVIQVGFLMCCYQLASSLLPLASSQEERTFVHPVPQIYVQIIHFQKVLKHDEVFTGLNCQMERGISWKYYKYATYLGCSGYWDRLHVKQEGGRR
jgi:hypothetical protein